MNQFHREPCFIADPQKSHRISIQKQFLYPQVWICLCANIPSLREALLEIDIERYSKILKDIERYWKILKILKIFKDIKSDFYWFDNSPPKKYFAKAGYSCTEANSCLRREILRKIFKDIDQYLSKILKIFKDIEDIERYWRYSKIFKDIERY